MPDSADTVQNEIRSSDPFSELVDELAARFHDQDYKDSRIPDIKANFQERAEAAGLPSNAAQQAAGRLIGTLIQQAKAKAPSPPKGQWDSLISDEGPLPEKRYVELPGPMYHLLDLIQKESSPFRQAHRLIDAIEWAVKWHTTLVLSDLLSKGAIPDRVKLLLARSLQTPTLGIWNHFFREAVLAFEESEEGPSLPWDRFERLTRLEKKHHLVAFRNEYAHGATPTEATCQSHVKQFLPVLRELIHTPLFTDVRLAVCSARNPTSVVLHGPERQPVDASGNVDLPAGHAAALLPDAAKSSVIDLWPLGISHHIDADTDTASINTDAVTVGETQFFFFNALKNKSVDQLNYEGPLRRRDASLYDPFFERLPLRTWKQKTSDSDFAHAIAPVEALTNAFKGRRAERAHLRDFAVHGDGTLMVTGAPGIGKSALLAQVTKEMEAGVDADGFPLTDADGTEIDAPPIIAYFIRRSEGTDDPVTFLKFMCRRIDQRYKLKGLGLGNDTSTLYENLRNRVHAVKEQAGGTPDRTVLLVDGLDEAPELARYVPAARPWFPVIVASRNTPEAQNFYEERPATERKRVTVGPMGPNEVRAMLYEGVNKYDPAFSDAYVEAITERSEGNPLYLKLLTESLFQGELEIGNVDVLPKEMVMLYRSAVQRVTNQGKNENVVQLLHLLAEAKSPLPPEAIGELLEMNSMEAEATVHAAMELLHEVSPQTLYPTQEDKRRIKTNIDVAAVQLFHESLREWLQVQHSGACTKMQTHLAKQTAAWTERTNGAAQRYALRYGAAHQRISGRTDALWALLTDTEYTDAQVNTFKQYDATYNSLQHGLDVYADQNGPTVEDDVRLSRLALKAGDVAQEAQTGVRQAFRWAEAGRMDDALKRIEVLDEEKYFLAVLRLLWIEADRQAKRPKDKRSPEIAQAVLNALDDRIAPGTDTLDWSDFVDPDFMAWWTERILIHLPSLEISSIIRRTSKQRDSAAAALAKQMSKCSSNICSLIFQTIIRIVKAIDDDWRRAFTLNRIATSFVKTGQFAKARSTIQMIDENLRHDYNSAMMSLIDALIKAGKLQDARIEARKIESANYRAMALLCIGAALIEDSLEEQAHFIFEEARNTTNQVINNKQAIAINQEIERAHNCSGDLKNITTSLPNFHVEIHADKQTIGALKEARSKTKVTENTSQHNEISQDVKVALVESSPEKRMDITLEEKIVTVQVMDYTQDRAWTLKSIVTSLAETGRFAEARSTIQMIDDHLRHPCNLSMRDLISALIEEGKFEKARIEARKIKRAMHRADALLYIGTALVQTGLQERACTVFEEACDAAHEIIARHNPKRYIKTLRRIGTALIEMGLKEQAQAVFGEARDATRKIMIGNEEHRAEALLRIGTALIGTDLEEEAHTFFAEARNTVHELDPKSHNHDHVLQRMATILAERGEIKEALIFIRMIDEDVKRSKVLRSIVISSAKSLRSSKIDVVFQLNEHVFELIDHNRQKIDRLRDKEVDVFESGADRQALFSIFEKFTALEEENCALSIGLLHGTSTVLAQAGRFQEVRTILEEARNATQAIRDNLERASALQNIGMALIKAKQFGEARTVLKEAHNAAQAIRRDVKRASALQNIGTAFVKAEQFEEACTVLKEARNVAQKICCNVERADTLKDIGATFAKAKQFKKARAVFEESCTAAQAIGKTVPRIDGSGHRQRINRKRARVLKDIGIALVEAEQFEEARTVLKEAHTRAIRSEFERTKTLQDIAVALAKAEHSEEALAAAQAIHDEVEHVDMLASLSYIATEQGNDTQAYAFFENTIEAIRRIADLSERAKAITNITAQHLQSASPKQLATHLHRIHLSRDGWARLLSTWREGLLSHAEPSLPLLRGSFTLYPFDQEAATKGVYALVQGHAQAGNMETVAAISAACPELGLDVRAPEPELPLPDGFDPETLPDSLQGQFDAYVADYKKGNLTDTALREKVGVLFDLSNAEKNTS